MKMTQQWVLLLLTLSLSYSSVFAANPSEQVADWMTEGWRSTASVDFVQAPASSPVPFVASIAPPPLTPQRERLMRLVDMRFALPGTRVAIMSRQRKTIFERYLDGKASQASTPIGYSISKSLVALAVGKALCDGSISSIEDRGEKYLEGLSGTSWGLASIRHLLTMSSGAFRPDTMQPTGWKHAQDGLNHRPIYSGQLQLDYVDMMRSIDERVSTPGSEFNYNNYDTIALSMIVEAATKQRFSKYFEQAIWSQVRPEGEGAWIRNEQGQVASFMGFSARPMDWVRLGHYVLDELKGQGCFSDFLRQATKHQVKANWSFQKSYGYQIWTNCTAKAGSFCFLGVHGQNLVMHPETDTVLYVHGTQNQISSSWHQIFESLE